MKIPRANYSFGQRVKLKWREAGCPDTEGIVTSVGISHMTHRVVYEIVEIDDDGKPTEGYIDGITEDMLSI